VLIVRILISVLAVFSSACGQPDKGQINPELAPYVAEFNALAQTSQDRITVEFAELYGDEAGRFIKGSEGFITILINPASWKYACPSQRRALIFHEMGHAVLGRVHLEGITYMNTNLQICNFYDSLKTELDAEMFNH
jgi:hypothetical protein